MEDLKTNEKLNNTVEDLQEVPEVPRDEAGKIIIEKVAIGKDEKDNYIIPDIIFDNYYKELPNKVINESRSWRTANGGKIKILGSNPADAYIHRKGAEASNATQAQRRSYRESVLFWNSKNVPKFIIEATAGRYEIPEGMSLQDAQVLAQQYKSIVKEDTAAFLALRDTAGEKPTDKINAAVSTIDEDTREMLLNVMKRPEGEELIRKELIGH